MYENLMEQAVTPENYGKALEAVKRNEGAPGIDGMRAAELEKHLETHWEKIRAKLQEGTYIPAPVKRVEIPKPGGGVRMLGIPTVVDRFIQQLLLHVMTPIYEPLFSNHSYGFRPGRSPADAMRAAQEIARQGKDWVEQRLLAVEDADARGAEDLVAAEGVKIGVERLHIHLHMGRGLRAVDQREGAGLVGHADDLADRVDGAQGFGHVGDGHHPGARLEQLFVLLHEEFAAVVHGNDA